MFVSNSDITDNIGRGYSDHILLCIETKYDMAPICSYIQYI